jgi:integrase
VLPAVGDYRLSELRRREVQTLADEMLGAGLSPSTVRNAIDPLRAIYLRAIQRDEVIVNPTTNLGLPASRKKRDRIATPGEARALLDALPPSERATWATAFYAGLRRGELRALRRADVELGRSEISVQRSWDQYEGPIDPKSEASALGHSTITETFDRYGHLFPGARDEARARMDAYLEAELTRVAITDPRSTSG